MTVIIEDFSPMLVGDTLVVFAPQFVHKDGSAVDLSGLSLSMKMQNEAGVTQTCDPTKWTIDDIPGGKAHYQWQAADVATAGTWTLWIALTDGTGKVVHADDKILVIQPVVWN